VNLQKLIKKYINLGFNEAEASSKLCQDLILVAISKSKYSKNITIKGGVVMHNLSNNIRRATRDLDLDFIKYSLNDDSISLLISELNNSFEDIKFTIIGKIKPLHHEDYKGKRVFIKIEDRYNNLIETKIDIGVHKKFEIKQDLYFFDFNTINLGANLLINSPEQIFVEKLKSLLKYNIRSTRYKDLFDLYYLIDSKLLDEDRINLCLDTLIYKDTHIDIDNIKELNVLFNSIMNSKLYRENINNSKHNWIDKEIDEVIEIIKDYINSRES